MGDQVVPLVNATTFGAINFIHGKNSFGMPFHIEISLINGIETPYQHPEQYRRALMYVPPAATWIILAGQKIYELCQGDYDRKDGAKGSTPEGDEWLWGQGRGYSLGRWAFWKKRFGEIATTPSLKDLVKELSARAESEMSRIETVGD